jgi:hypothetical protein
MDKSLSELFLPTRPLFPSAYPAAILHWAQLWREQQHVLNNSPPFSPPLTKPSAFSPVKSTKSTLPSPRPHQQQQQHLKHNQHHHHHQRVELQDYGGDEEQGLDLSVKISHHHVPSSSPVENRKRKFIPPPHITPDTVKRTLSLAQRLSKSATVSINYSYLLT